MIYESTGVKRIINAFAYSWKGFKSAYVMEEAFRQEVWLAAVLIPLAFWVGDTGLEIIVLISSILFMLIVELLNSSIEAVVDRFGPEWNEYAGRAKDMGSAAVLLAGCIVFISWLMVVFF